MSYLLIGNISALISEDCIEPLAGARLRVYLPDYEGRTVRTGTAQGCVNHLRRLSYKEVVMKTGRLLAEATLDEKGNFSIAWDGIQLFTESLELDICLPANPGKTDWPKEGSYHLSTLQPHWKRTNDRYIAAYAYVVPADKWNEMCAGTGVWVITGTVRHFRSYAGQPRLRVEAWNAATGHLLGSAMTNEFGRYKLQFGRKEMTGGQLMFLHDGQQNHGPDVYFKIYRHQQLVWEEEESVAERPGRKDLPPCTSIDILYRSSVIRRTSDHFSHWLHDMLAAGGRRKRNKDYLKWKRTNRLIVKDSPHV